MLRQEHEGSASPSACLSISAHDAILLLDMYRILRFGAFSIPESLSIWLYEIQSSSSAGAVSRLAICLMTFRPRDRIRRLSMPAKEPIFSMLLVERARCLERGEPGPQGGP